MRVGVHAGPFYASTSTRRRKRGGGGVVLPVIAVAFGLGWPFLITHHAWVWAIAIPWWMIAACGSLAAMAPKSRPPGARRR